MALVLSKTLNWILDPVLILFVMSLFSFGESRFWSRFFYLTAAVLVIFTPLSSHFLRDLEKKYEAPQSLDPAIRIGVVLGGDSVQFDLRLNQFSYAASFDRVGEALRLLKEHKLDTVIYTGASSHQSDRVLSETDSFVKMAEEYGISKDQIITDPKARTTRENAQNVKVELQRMGVNKFYLITSASHMWRAMKVFERLELTPTPFPVGYETSDLPFSIDYIGLDQLNALAILVHESLGMLYYKMFGYI